MKTAPVRADRFTRHWAPLAFDRAMGKHAEQIYTEQADIDRMEAFVAQMPSTDRVRLHFIDGQSVAGVVTARPSVQLFRTYAGDEGMNGVVRLDDPSIPEGSGFFWLDRIARVEPLDIA